MHCSFIFLHNDALLACYTIERKSGRFGHWTRKGSLRGMQAEIPGLARLAAKIAQAGPGILLANSGCIPGGFALILPLRRSG